VLLFEVARAALALPKRQNVANGCSSRGWVREIWRESEGRVDVELALMAPSWTGVLVWEDDLVFADATPSPSRPCCFVSQYVMRDSAASQCGQSHSCPLQAQRPNPPPVQTSCRCWGVRYVRSLRARQIWREA